MGFLTDGVGHLHPLVVHFPVALLVTAPVFVLLAVVGPGAWRRGFAVSALVLLGLGTIGAWVGMSTGEAVEDAVHVTGQAEAVLERHEELAEVVAKTFTVLTGILLAIVLLPALVARLDRPALVRAALAVFLALLLGGDLLLAKAAHEGGRLVHEFGVNASAGPPTATVATAAVPTGEGD